MSLAVPITNGHMNAGATTFSSGAATPPVAAGAGNASEVQGTGRLTAPHNTPLHCGGIVLFAGVVIFAFHYLGFRMAVDVGLGR